jgi:addiction module antidote protein, HigA family
MKQKMTRRPTHPGEIIKYDYMEPLDFTIKDLAEKLHTSRKTLSGIINGHTAVTVDMALRLSRAFDTSPGLWLNLQQAVDLWKANNSDGEWKTIERVFIPDTQPEIHA